VTESSRRPGSCNTNGAPLDAEELTPRPQLVRRVEAAGADGAVTDACPTWPILLAWIENDLPDEESQLLNTHVADCDLWFVVSKSDEVS